MFVTVVKEFIFGGQFWDKRREEGKEAKYTYTVISRIWQMHIQIIELYDYIGHVFAQQIASAQIFQRELSMKAKRRHSVALNQNTEGGLHDLIRILKERASSTK